MHPEATRIAAVFGDRQGSGYLLSPRLVLTADHVAGEAKTITAIVPAGRGRIACEVVWRGPAQDMALLRAGEDLADPDLPTWDEPVEVGLPVGLWPLRNTQVIGFPAVQRGANGELDSEHLVGTLKPGSKLLSGTYVLDGAGTPPTAVPGAPSPWSGLSGAAAWFEGTLVGVVRSDPEGWQHGRVELTPSRRVVFEGGFGRACADEHVKLRQRLLPQPVENESESFERLLLQSTAEEWNRVVIYGLTRSSGTEDSWPLDLAYLDLELTAGNRPGTARKSSMHTAEALSDQRRVLLRGAAGSGKTTLLQWLAKGAARDELPATLQQFRDCVPLLLRLRSLVRQERLPAPEDFLAAAYSPVAGHPASSGWMTRRMAEGTVLLLVDGVDEVPEDEREAVRDWLGRLLGAYPDVRYVITTRPSAVADGWLDRWSFSEFDLLPMNRRDVTTFIQRWHKAAASTASAAEQQRLDLLRDGLNEAVGRKQDLSRLATNPLMCALVCALNRDRNGYLPSGRMELYEAALEMLLVRRDKERRIPESVAGLSLSAREQIALLQRLAYWLIRNEQSEISYPDAVAGVELALASMRQVSVGPEAVLRHLLIRSGLLRMPGPDAVDFLHRTFQDYLGAQAAVESRDFPLLAAHAHQDQWEDVVRLAVGHGRPDERSDLLGRILARADAEPEHRHRLRLLATACLDLAVQLDPAVRSRVEEAAAELIPPQGIDAALELASAGPIVLDLLPGPAGLDGDTALAVTLTAVTIGSERAVPLLASYAAHPDLRVRQQLAWAWERFEVTGYGKEVIARLRRDDALTIPVNSSEQLRIASALTGSLRLALSSPLDGSALARLPADNLVGLRLHDLPGPLDLSPLGRAGRLREFHLSGPSLELDLEQLTRLSPVRLSLTDWARVTGWHALEQLESVRELLIGAPDPGLTAAAHPGALTLPPYLSHLRISTAVLALAGLPRLDHLSGLTSLEIDHSPDEAARFPRAALWESLRSLTAITELTLRDFPAEVVADLPATPTLRRLEVRCTRGTPELGRVARKFPLLRELVVEYPDSAQLLDLRGLERLRRCRVVVRTPAPRANAGPLQQLDRSAWLYTVP